jgi:hypothetical protein
MSLDFYIESVKCDYCGREADILFERNITHNLNFMAVAVNLYDVLWHPEKIAQVVLAKDIVPRLESALRLLISDPASYDEFESDNGWGTYEDFVKFVEAVLEACLKYPEGVIRASI